MVCVAALVLQVGAALYALMDITACQSPLPTLARTAPQRCLCPR